jgi:predicted CoA-substrate-specific enzyme activase
VSGPAAIGVDVGSTTCKAVAIDAAGTILDRRVEPTDPRIERQVERLVAAVGKGAVAPLGATGYGRKRVPGARALTEITCHARGAFARTGRAALLVDMGGQDTKVIRLGPGGEVLDFAMNDKCAAGTGRFLEVILGRLQVPLDGLAERAARAPRAVPVSSTCTVFAESEVISLVAGDEPLDGIVRGLHVALACLRSTASCQSTRSGSPITLPTPTSSSPSPSPPSQQAQGQGPHAQGVRIGVVPYGRILLGIGCPQRIPRGSWTLALRLTLDLLVLRGYLVSCACSCRHDRPARA